MQAAHLPALRSASIRAAMIRPRFHPITALMRGPDFVDGTDAREIRFDHLARRQPPRLIAAWSSAAPSPRRRLPEFAAAIAAPPNRFVNRAPPAAPARMKSRRLVATRTLPHRNTARQHSMGLMEKHGSDGSCTPTPNAKTKTQ